MKNLLGLLLALGVAIGGVIVAGRLLHWSPTALGLVAMAAGMAVTSVYDSIFGTGSDNSRIKSRIR